MSLSLLGISENISALSTVAVIDNTLTTLSIIDAGPLTFQDASGNVWFPRGENFFIESIRFQLDYSFGNGSPAGISFVMNYLDDNANSGFITEFGDNGQGFYPTFNCDLPVNTFIEMPSNVTAKWSVNISGLFAQVSMLNVPDSINGQTLNMRTFLKIKHTLQMVA